MPDAPRLPDDVAQIPLPTPFAIGPVNAYLLRGEPLTLVDPGPLLSETRAELGSGLATHGYGLEDIELVLLTHQHMDHVGLARAVADAGNADVAGSQKLARFMRDFEGSMELDDRYSVATMLRHGIDDKVAESLRQLTLAFRRFAVDVDIRVQLDEGARIRAGSRELTVMHRPGHSPTDTVFLDESDGLMIAGDHLLDKVSSNPIAHWPIDDREPEQAATSADRRRPLAEYIDSLERTAELDVSLVLPGHGEPFTDHRGVIERRVAMHARRARKIRRTLDEPATAAQIGHRLWRGLPVTEAYLVLSEVLGHLDLLEQEGRVRQVEAGDVVKYEAA